MDLETFGPYIGTWRFDAEIEREGTPWAPAPDLRVVAWSAPTATLTSRWTEGPHESTLGVVPDGKPREEAGRRVGAWLDEESFDTNVTSEAGWTDEHGRTVGLQITVWKLLDRDTLSVVETRVDKGGALGSIEALYRRVAAP